LSANSSSDLASLGASCLGDGIEEEESSKANMKPNQLSPGTSPAARVQEEPLESIKRWKKPRLASLRHSMFLPKRIHTTRMSSSIFPHHI